jgi:hypothetical protein
MPNSDQQITLNVNDDHSWSYSGGNDGNGNVSNKVGQGPSKLHITLNASANFEIVNADFSGTGLSNFTQRVHSQGRKLQIDNTCASAADVYYQVNVKDTSNGNIILCDPKIVNS